MHSSGVWESYIPGASLESTLQCWPGMYSRGTEENVDLHLKRQFYLIKSVYFMVESKNHIFTFSHNANISRPEYIPVHHCSCYCNSSLAPSKLTILDRLIAGQVGPKNLNQNSHVPKSYATINRNTPRDGWIEWPWSQMGSFSGMASPLVSLSIAKLKSTWPEVDL